MKLIEIAAVSSGSRAIGRTLGDVAAVALLAPRASTATAAMRAARMWFPTFIAEQTCVCGGRNANMCSPVTVVAVMLPRFPLVVAAGGAAALRRPPAALAPEPGREQLVGEVSPAAEAFGVKPGLRVGEA